MQEEKKTVETVRDGESWEDKLKKVSGLTQSTLDNYTYVHWLHVIHVQQEYDDYLTMEVKMLIKLGIIQTQDEPDN